jgi:hypothetical protein
MVHVIEVGLLFRDHTQVLQGQQYICCQESGKILGSVGNDYVKTYWHTVENAVRGLLTMRRVLWDL